MTLIKVVSGDGTDRVLNTSPLPITIDAGAGNDALTGGGRADTIQGGTGSDVMQGNSGNDILLARDNTSDSVINCDGPGTPGDGGQGDPRRLAQGPELARLRLRDQIAAVASC